MQRRSASIWKRAGLHAEQLQLDAAAWSFDHSSASSADAALAAAVRAHVLVYAPRAPRGRLACAALRPQSEAVRSLPIRADAFLAHRLLAVAVGELLSGAWLWFRQNFRRFCWLVFDERRRGSIADALE